MFIYLLVCALFLFIIVFFIFFCLDCDRKQSRNPSNLSVSKFSEICIERIEKDNQEISHKPSSEQDLIVNWNRESGDQSSRVLKNFKSFSPPPPPPLEAEELMEENDLQVSNACDKKSDQVPGRKSILKSEGSRSTHSNVAFVPEFSGLDFTAGGGGGSLPPMCVLRKAHAHRDDIKKSPEGTVNTVSPAATGKARASIVTLDMQELNPARSSLIAIVDLHSISSRFAGWPRSSLYSARQSRASRPSFGDDFPRIDPLDELNEWRKNRDEKLKEIDVTEKQINNNIAKAENKKKYEFSAVKHSLIPERTGLRKFYNQ